MKGLILFACLGFCIWLGLNYLPLPSPPDVNINSIEQDVFNSINTERKNHNLHELQWDLILHDMAQEHSKWMVATNNLTHSNYGICENCWRGIGYKPDELASICFVTWRDSPRHYENMLDPSINHCAIGFAQSDNETYATFLAK